MENYTKIRVLGKGAFGAAWLVQRKRDTAQFVAKEVKLAGMKPRDREEAKHEITMLRKLNHPNITKYIDHFEHQGSLFIVMEYANGGDLYTKIKNRKMVKMKESEVMHYFVQITLALKHLHENRILHRDLKTQNIFLTKDGIVKMGDFGISTVLRNTYELKRTVCGTPYYFSPELCLNKPYNNKSDVWALGCILYELTTLTHAFDGMNMKGLVNNILRGIYKPIHSSYSKELGDLIRSMLMNDPSKRPNVNQIVSSGYVRNYLSKLQGDAQQANADHRSMINQADKEKEKADAQLRVQADLAARKKREEQAAKVAEERKKAQEEKVARIRAQMAAEAKAHEEKMALVRERQKAQEAERAARAKEMEARNRAAREEERKIREQRAAAQARANRAREEEWERNMKQQQEDNRRRQEQAQQQMAYQEQRRVEENEARRRREQQQAVDAAQMYKELRREAAANRARAAMDEPQANHSPVQEQPQQHLPPVHQQAEPAAQPRRRVLTAEEEAEERKNAYWAMRREAEANKRRLMGLDPLPEQAPTPQPQQQAPPPQPQYASPVQQHQQYAPQPQQPLHEALPPVHQAPPVQHHVTPVAPPVVAAVADSSDEDDEDAGMRRFLNNDAVANQEELDVSREADYHGVQAAIAQALQPDAAAVDEDFEDAPTDPTHFVIDGQTLHLPNAGAGDPLMHRIESLRLFLEASLGEDLFYSAYRILDSTECEDNEANVGQVERLLNPAHHKYIPVITQLLVCEEFFNQQANA